jgi:hypothetical protein
MVKIRVQNVPGTAGQVSPYPYQNLSWLEYWERKLGRKAHLCGVCGCYRRAEHGGHVKRCDVWYDQDIYIVPLCAECNNPNNKDEFYIDCELCPIK